MISRFHIPLLLLFLTGACSSNQQASEEDGQSDKAKSQSQETVQAPEFNADSAYHFIEKQVNFGPRVPNTKPHAQAAHWLTRKMKHYADRVKVQEGEVTAFNGKTLQIQNIRASFNPDKTKKILLCAHWDTRPFADMDSVNQDKPIPGANDGGSGVGVLLEIARQLSRKAPAVGVEILLFDAEDYGAPKGKQKRGKDSRYCLGSAYWAKRIDPNQYFADYGILLDMVGSKNAVFKREGYSTRHAPQIIDKVWNIAYNLEYSGYFSYQKTGPVMDDHVNLIRYANIPTINIIDFDSQREHGFRDYWHTHDDDMSVISRKTLKAVGQTVLTNLFREDGVSG